MPSEDNTNVRDIFFTASELPPEQRAAYLASACSDNLAMRHEIEMLLAAETGNVENSPRSPASSTAAAVVTLETPGLVLANRYKLIDRIGEGGMGSVWLASQSEPVKRKVAVKIIKLGMDSRQVLTRFDAERQALALMDHPNIAKVFDGGLAHDGRPFFVMELVKGTPITEYCDANKMSLRGRLELFVPVCQAIQHAHQKGIIHRDIKPANVLIALYDDRPIPKVIDFGVAKATGQALTTETLNTGFSIIGTPQYMSPEQATLNNLDIDTRSDIYSLGVLLYELLAGSPPFTKQELDKKGLVEMLRVVREEEPAKPSTRLSTADALASLSANRSIEPRKLTRTLRRELDWVVLKAIEKNRARRYETANGFTADILRYLAGEPVVAHPPSAGYRLRKFVRRHRPQVIAGSLVLIALLAGIAGTAFGLVRTNRQAARAEAGERLAKDRLVLVAAERDAKESARKNSQDISNFLSDVFKSPDPARDGRSITVAELLDRAAKKLESDATIQPDQRAGLQAALGSSYSALGLVGNAISLQEKVRDYRLAALGSENPDTIFAMSSLAVSYYQAGRSQDAIKIEEEVLSIRKKRLGPEHRDTLSAMNNLAAYYRAAGQRDQALKIQEDVLSLCRKTLDARDPTTINAVVNLAISCDDAGRREEALTLGQEAVRLYTQTLGRNASNTLTAMNNLASYYSGANRMEEAMTLREQVLDDRRKALGPVHPDTLWAMQALAVSYCNAGRTDAGIKLGEEAVNLSIEHLGLTNPATLTTMNNVASNYAGAGLQDQALKMRKDVFDLRKQKLGPNHPDTLWAMHALADSYADTGRTQDALAMREDVLTRYQNDASPENPDTLYAMTDLARSYNQSGRPNDAINLQEQAVTLFKKVLGAEHPDSLDAIDELGQMLSQSGNFSKSQQVLADCLTLRNKTEPDAWTTFNTQSTLGGALLGQKKFAEAGPLILSGYQGMKQREASISALEKIRLPQALDRLIQLYIATNKPDEVKKWRAERSLYPSAATQASR